MSKQATSSLTSMELFDILEHFIVHVDQKFEEMNQRFSDVDNELRKINQTLTYHETWLRKIDDRLDGMATKQQLSSLLSILEQKQMLNSFEVSHVESR